MSILKFFGRKEEKVESSQTNVPSQEDISPEEALEGTMLSVFCYFDKYEQDLSSLTSSGFSVEEIKKLIEDAKSAGIYEAAVKAYK